MRHFNEGSGKRKNILTGPGRKLAVSIRVQREEDSGLQDVLVVEEQGGTDLLFLRNLNQNELC